LKNAVGRALVGVRIFVDLSRLWLLSFVNFFSFVC